MKKIGFLQRFHALLRLKDESADKFQIKKTETGCLAERDCRASRRCKIGKVLSKHQNTGM